MVNISEVNLINCPDCGYISRDDYNYCRFCGHDYHGVVEESSGRLSRFIKKSNKGIVYENLRYCTNCKTEITDFTTDFCENCGAIIPFQNVIYFCPCGNVKSNDYCDICYSNGNKKKLNAEEFYQIWHNQVIVPLSNEYNKDLSKNDFKKYFNLSNEEVNHIVYKMVHSIIFDKVESNVVEFFKTLLNETRTNYKDIEKALINTLEKNIKERFNKEGLSSYDTTTIKAGFNETIETPHIQNKHGTGTKVLATAVAGPLGFVATSGIKQEIETKQVYHKGNYFHSKVIISNKNVSYLTYTDQNSAGFNESRNDINKVVIDWKDIKDFDDNYFILNSGESFKCPPLAGVISEISKHSTLDVVGSINETFNKQLFSNYLDIRFDKSKSIINNIIKDSIKSNKAVEVNNASISELEALEKLMNMYKEGLLTDEEFALMKKKLME